MKATVNLTFSTPSVEEPDPSVFSEQLVEALQDVTFYVDSEEDEETEEVEEIEYSVTEVEVLNLDG